MKISVIIPVYNEQRIIKHTIIKLHKYMSSNFSDYEIIIVNDGSKDKTKFFLNDMYLKVTAINLNKNHGKGYAIKTGVMAANGDYIIFMDADLSYDLENIKKMVNKLYKNDIVIATRNTDKKGYGFTRKIVSNAFGHIVSYFLKEKMDTQCGLKGFRLRCAKNIFSLIKTNRFAFDFEVLYIAKKLKYSIDSVDVYINFNSKSSINFVTDPIIMIFDVLKVKILDIFGAYKLKESDLIEHKTIV